jgi:hypothetical protein
VFGPLFDLYYRIGPPIARTMGKHPSLKHAIRYGLIAPLVAALRVVDRSRTAMRGRDWR